MGNVKIFTAYHKDFPLPYDTNLFIPIHVGKKLSQNDLGFLGDDSGDNISIKNPNYCELTMHYWIWKNYDLSDIDYIGIAHYRRLFDINKMHGNLIDIYLPNKEYIGSPLLNFSVEQNYKYAHIPEDFEIMKKVLFDKYPEYKKYEYVFSKRRCISYLNKAYFYNMFIMKKDLFLEYSKRLFDILFECEKHIAISPYGYQARVFGFLGERLLNIWIEKKEQEGKKISNMKIKLY